MNEELEQLAHGIKSHFDAQTQEMKRHFDATSEALRSDVRTIAEAVGAVSDKLDRTAQELRDDTTSGFAETQAMIKFSHADLDRRLTVLEARVDRLETLVTGSR